MAQQTPDQIARSLGFPSAAALMAFHNHQQQMTNQPTEVAKPAAKAAPAQTPAEGILQHILSYLPLAGAMQKAGSAMGK